MRAGSILMLMWLLAGSAFAQVDPALHDVVEVAAADGTGLANGIAVFDDGRMLARMSRAVISFDAAGDETARATSFGETGAYVMPTRMIALDDGRVVALMNQRDRHRFAAIAADGSLQASHPFDGEPIPYVDPIIDDDSVTFAVRRQGSGDEILRYGFDGTRLGRYPLSAGADFALPSVAVMEAMTGGGVVMVDSQFHPFAGSRNVIRRLDDSLQPLWSQDFASLSGARIEWTALRGTRDGGVIATGLAADSVVIARLDAFGALRWQVPVTTGPGVAFIEAYETAPGVAFVGLVQNQASCAMQGTLGADGSGVASVCDALPGLEFFWRAGRQAFDDGVALAFFARDKGVPVLLRLDRRGTAPASLRTLRHGHAPNGNVDEVAMSAARTAAVLQIDGKERLLRWDAAETPVIDRATPAPDAVHASAASAAGPGGSALYALQAPDHVHLVHATAAGGPSWQLRLPGTRGAQLRAAPDGWRSASASPPRVNSITPGGIVSWSHAVDESAATDAQIAVFDDGRTLLAYQSSGCNVRLLSATGAVIGNRPVAPGYLFEVTALDAGAVIRCGSTEHGDLVAHVDANLQVTPIDLGICAAYGRIVGVGGSRWVMAAVNSMSRLDLCGFDGAAPTGSLGLALPDTAYFSPWPEVAPSDDGVAHFALHAGNGEQDRVDWVDYDPETNSARHRVLGELAAGEHPYAVAPPDAFGRVAWATGGSIPPSSVTVRFGLPGLPPTSVHRVPASLQPAAPLLVAGAQGLHVGVAEADPWSQVIFRHGVMRGEVVFDAGGFEAGD